MRSGLAACLLAAALPACSAPADFSVAGMSATDRASIEGAARNELRKQPEFLIVNMADAARDRRIGDVLRSLGYVTEHDGRLGFSPNARLSSIKCGVSPRNDEWCSFAIGTVELIRLISGTSYPAGTHGGGAFDEYKLKVRIVPSTPIGRGVAQAGLLTYDGKLVWRGADVELDGTYATDCRCIALFPLDFSPIS